MVDGGGIRIGVFATVPSLLGRQGHGLSHLVILFVLRDWDYFSVTRIRCFPLSDKSLVVSYSISRSFILISTRDSVDRFFF